MIDGPLSAAIFPWQLLPPENALVIVAKTTFDIDPDGAVTPSQRPAPLCGDRAPDPDAAVPALSYPSDFEPFKPKADVLLVGHAYPHGNPRVSRVAFHFGSHAWSLAAIGDRRWQSGVPSEPSPFQRIPLDWLHAFGGPGYAENPLGIGIVEGAAGLRLPNLELSERLIHSPADRPSPACFAPVPRTFRQRAGKLGRYDAAWLAQRWPYFPADFDTSYCNSAPCGQQVPYPRGDETFDLLGVHAERAALRGRLPGNVARAFAQHTRDQGFRFEEVALRLDTVFFDTDGLRVTLVWRGLIHVSHERAPELAAVFVCDERLDAPLAPDAAQRRFTALLAAENATDASVTDRLALAVVEKLRRQPASEETSHEPAMSREQLEVLLRTGLALNDEDLSYADLSNLNLTRRKLRRAILTGANLRGARLDGADLSGATLLGADARGASFERARLELANLTRAKLARASFKSADLGRANLDEVEADGASFESARAEGASFVAAQLAGAVFDAAELGSADLNRTLLENASFRSARLSGANLCEVRAARAHFDAAWLENACAEQADLTACSFTGAHADGAVLTEAKLDAAGAVDAELSSAVLDFATLRDADLTRAVAKQAQFCGADLSGAKLLGANLMQSNFESANLERADLRGANLYQVDTWKATLGGANLELAFAAGSKLSGRR